jgi:SAM-dependent methyltransferase
MRKVINWITDEELKKIYTQEYWNNVELEKTKEFWIENGNYEVCLKHLNRYLISEYEHSEKYIKDYGRDNIKVADLASGIGWTSTLISKIDKVKEVHSVEISKHRIGILFEECIKMLSGDEEKLFRYLGSFYDLKFESETMDILYLSQAFHHADAPIKLLVECERVLKKKGRIILVGEHFISLKMIIRRFISNFVKNKNIKFNFYELFPPDNILGDHYYRVSDYFFMFNSLGFSLKYEKLKNGTVIYVADKN